MHMKKIAIIVSFFLMASSSIYAGPNIPEPSSEVKYIEKNIKSWLNFIYPSEGADAVWALVTRCDAEGQSDTAFCACLQNNKELSTKLGDYKEMFFTYLENENLCPS